MTAVPKAPEILDREFLEIRAHVLTVAASLDRLDRAENTVRDDPRMTRLRRALEVLLSDRPDRAERVQLVFSLDYDPTWRGRLNVSQD